MAKKKKATQKEYKECAPIPCGIVETLETNYMPYAMSVIMSRAIPEIDGLKPAHRKLLYTMYALKPARRPGNLRNNGAPHPWLRGNASPVY